MSSRRACFDVDALLHLDRLIVRRRDVVGRREILFGERILHRGETQRVVVLPCALLATIPAG